MEWHTCLDEYEKLVIRMSTPRFVVLVSSLPIKQKLSKLFVVSQWFCNKKIVVGFPVDFALYLVLPGILGLNSLTGF